MRPLPAGTVTLLFTDIEGSTRLLHELGDSYADVLAEHRRVLRDAFARHGGVEVDTQGDAFFYAFARAKDAAAAAQEGQRALAAGPVLVRMGVHTGAPRVTEEGYVGADVHRAARIMGAGHGGQVLVSSATRQLLDSDLELRDLGEHRLKDLDAPERIFQLGDGAFPPLKSLNNTNLPQQLEPLLGRKRELADLLKLIRREGVRLVTLTGPGGIGKTRLALELASELVGDFIHGVWFVDLSAVRDPDLVEPTIAGVVGGQGELTDHIGDRSVALVLDNLEQVIAVAPAVSRLLVGCPQLVLVVTSREPLRVGGEREYALRPLAEAPAVELFRQRATATAPHFEASYVDLADVCARLDSLPLAIELAAARSKTLSAHELRARLERRLPLLSKGRRDAPERQQTLRATIDWSYELLTREEQAAFAKLAVFAGGWSLAAAEQVCDVDVDVLESLVDKSLVRHVDGRYSMFETIREYAAERLRDSGHGDDAKRHHAEYFLAVAKSANLSDADEGEQRHDVAEREHDNFRNALAWSLDSGEVELGLRLAISLEGFWVAAHPFEGVRWFDALLARAEHVSRSLHARAVLAHGGVVFIVGEFERGTRLYEQSLAEYRALGDERGAANVLHRLANSALAGNDLKRARALAEESLELHRRFGSRKGEGIALGTIGDVEWRSGLDPKRALELARESAAIAGETGFVWWQAHMLYNICEWSLALGRAEDAAKYAHEALELAYRIADRMLTVYLLALLARIAAVKGDDERAGTLWGALEAEEQRGTIGQWEAERETYAAPVLADAAAEFERGRRTGRGLPLSEAVAYALDESSIGTGGGG